MDTFGGLPKVALEEGRGLGQSERGVCAVWGSAGVGGSAFELLCVSGSPASPSAPPAPPPFAVPHFCPYPTRTAFGFADMLSRYHSFTDCT